MVQQLRDAASDGTVVITDRRRRWRHDDDGKTLAEADIDLIGDAKILVSHERLYAVARADRFAHKLLLLTQGEGVAPDDSMPSIEIFRAHTEVFTRCAMKWPEFFPGIDDADADGWSEEDAVEMGLSVYRRHRRRVRAVPTLPGCRWAGEPCESLRVFGHKYCPTHEKAVREELRSGR